MSRPQVPAASRARGVFVGRDAERSRLDLMLEAARQGRGGLVLLGGEPGVGKTRLASEILEDGRERGMLALAGHAYEEETAPWMTSREILQEMVRLLPAADLRRMLGDNASELSRLLPELRKLIRPSGGGREARYEFSHALVRQTLLSALSVPRLQRLHLRLADAMERAYGAKVEEHAAELAHQLDEAGAAAAPERVRRCL